MKKKEIKKLDTLFGLKIRGRGSCEWCGKYNEFMHCAHIISRKYHSTRWDPDNALALCPRCHFKAHSDPLLFADFVFDKMGKQKYYVLHLKSQMTIKIFYEDILKELK